MSTPLSLTERSVKNMSPRTPEQFEEMRESRRRQIMEAALELFASDGYSHCSMAQLAKHAGISKGLVYNYFESKEALLVAVIEDGVEAMMSMIDPNHDGILEPEEVEGFIRTLFQTMRGNLPFWVLFISVILQPVVKEFLSDQPYLLMMERFGPSLIEFFEGMGFADPMLEMFTFSAMIEGYGMLLMYMHPEGELPEETLQKYEDRVVELFARPNTQPL